MKSKKLEEALTAEPEAAKPAKYIRTGCDMLDILLGGKKDVYGI
jgi:hypothetical protein